MVTFFGISMMGGWRSLAAGDEATIPTQEKRFMVPEPEGVFGSVTRPFEQGMLVV